MPTKADWNEAKRIARYLKGTAEYELRLGEKNGAPGRLAMQTQIAAKIVEPECPTAATSQVGFAEFNNTADNRANIGGTIIGAPIVGQ